MSEHIDYYELLGVSRRASHDEIRKAYRKLALRWHPDKNPGQEQEAEATFKRISEAYDVLSDERKRSIYDTHGYEGLKEGGQRPDSGFHFRDTRDIFREVFGFDPFQSPFDGHGRGRARHPGHGHPFGGGLFGSFFGDDMFGGGFDDGFGGGVGRGFGDPFGGFGGFGDFGGMSMGSGSFSSISTSSGPGGMFSQSSETVIRDGKRVTTTRTTQNGVTSERVEEVDQNTGEVLSLMIDGQSQPVGRLEGPNGH